MQITEAFEKLQAYVTKIRQGDAPVYPGMDLEFTTACTPGDRIAQGDFQLTFRGFIDEGAGPPKDFVLKKGVKQLVPGNTVGAKHCVDDNSTCDLYFPADWSGESLQGPYIVARKTTKINHPKHGDVTIPAGMVIDATYQRCWDSQLRRERRAAD